MSCSRDNAMGHFSLCWNHRTLYLKDLLIEDDRLSYKKRRDFELLRFRSTLNVVELFLRIEDFLNPNPATDENVQMEEKVKHLSRRATAWSKCSQWLLAIGIPWFAIVIS